MNDENGGRFGTSPVSGDYMIKSRLLRKKILPEDCQKMWEMYQQGITLSEIGKAYNRPHGSVQYYIQKIGKPLGRPYPTQRDICPHCKQKYWTDENKKPKKKKNK